MEPSQTVTSRAERASAALRRVLDTAAQVLRGLTRLAVAAAVVTAIAWLAWVAHTPPPDANEWTVRAVVLAVLLAPSAVLLLFVAGLRELSRLPERARALPADVQERARGFRGTTRRRSERRGLLGVLVALFRLGRVVVGSRDVLSPFAAVTIALRPAILIAALFAALAAVVEIPAALIALVVLSLS
ncbi:MAG: hypothetical protein WB297_03985 [Actinomycetota bacterium]